MSGMGGAMRTNDPTIVAAFHRALLHQGLVVLVIAAVVAVAWNVLRGVQLRRAGSTLTAGPATGAGSPGTGPAGQPTPLAPAALAFSEPAARRLLRISFGLIWIFDGLLQGQASMPLGMVPQVVQPAAAASPSWVQHVVNAGTTVWTYHPVPAAAAAVWIQIGLGIWLLAAPRGNWSRLGGVATVGWGLVVWIFGEAFGGVFAPGLTWLFGAPGAVLLYCVAGVLIALPDRAWATARLGRVLLAVIGTFFVGMAVLQAWPGRGFWQGQAGHGATAGTLTAMVQQMAQTSQPHLFASWVTGFAGFDAAHGWAVNLFVVIALAAIGGAFLSGRPRVVRLGLAAGIVLCLADWILIEDLGFLGGVGTDPNSMIPLVLLITAGYLALTRPAVAAEAVTTAPAAPAAVPTWRRRWAVDPTYAFRSIAALGAVGITLIGAAPMAVAATNPNADPIISQAVDGNMTATNKPAPSFTLVDQHNRAVSLESLQGKAIALTFLDPVCTSDCPIIAQEFRMTNSVLGGDARNVELVAVDANPRYLGLSYLNAFDQQEGLDRVPNWLYLTGTLPQLQGVWRSFGAEVASEPGGAMIDHSEFAYVIDPTGHSRFVLNTDPGPATSATKSSFTVNLAHALEHALGRS